MRRLLLGIVSIWLLFNMMDIVTAAAADDKTKNLLDQQQQQLEEEIMRDTIAAGRGERDEIGVRDQWSSKEHLRSKNDIRAGSTVSADARRLLREYRLECDGCNQKEAVARINAFVIETKRITKSKQRWENAATVVLSIVAAAAAVFMLTRGSNKFNADGTTTVVNYQTRLEILEQRNQQARKEEDQQRSDAAKRAPTWRDREELEVWTAKQENQFAKARASFGGVSPKERYHLIAAKVNDKTKEECFMHHKLQQVIAKEQ